MTNNSDPTTPFLALNSALVEDALDVFSNHPQSYVGSEQLILSRDNPFMLNSILSLQERVGKTREQGHLAGFVLQDALLGSRVVRGHCEATYVPYETVAGRWALFSQFYYLKLESISDAQLQTSFGAEVAALLQDERPTRRALFHDIVTKSFTDRSMPADQPVRATPQRRAQARRQQRRR